MATKRTKPAASSSSGLVPKKTVAKVAKKPSRAQRYTQLFTPPVSQMASGGFFQQVHGYGTPLFSEVTSHAEA